MKSRKLKSILSYGILGTAIAVVGLTTSLSTYFEAKRSSLINTYYSFDGKQFRTFNELSRAMQNEYLSDKFNVANRNKWSIKDGDSILYFNDPRLLRDHVGNKITSYNSYSSYDITNDFIEGNGSINPYAFSKLHFINENDLLKNTSTVYKGINNSIKTSEQEAKDSYLSIHDAYYFNNMFFSNLEQLQLYLETDYFGENLDSPGYLDRDSALNIKSPSGNYYSNSINKDLLFSSAVNGGNDDILNAKNNLVSFIKSNSNKYLKMDDYSYPINMSDINSNNINFSNPDYTRIYSNNGLNSYIVDLNKDDKNSLFGPYFVSSTKNLELMYDTKNWKKISKDDPLVLEEKDLNSISSFISMFFVPDNNDFEDYPIDIHYLNDYLNDCFKSLRNFNYNFYSEFLSMYKTLSSGKKFNIFNSIIISYKWLINNLIYYKAPESLILKVKNTFNKIAKFIDFINNFIFSDAILTAKNGEKLSFEKILGFNDNNHNLNTTLNYYVDQISENWPQYIVCLNVINFAKINQMCNGGALKFDYSTFEEIINRTNSYEKNVFVYSNSSEYERLFNLFSSVAPDEFEKKMKSLISSDNCDKYNELIKSLSISFTMSADLISNPIKSLYENKTYDINLSLIYATGWAICDDDNIYKGFDLELAYWINKTNDEARKHLEDIENENYKTNEMISFKNFCLLKFISSIKINSLNLLTAESKKFRSYIISAIKDFKNNLIDNQDLENILNESIKTVSINDYMTHYQIFNDSKITMKELSNSNFAYNDFISNLLNYEEVLNNSKFLMKLNSEKMSIFTDILDIAKDITDDENFEKLIEKILPTFKMASAFFAYINIALDVLDIILGALVPKTEYFSYVFENDSARYIWNGGKKTTMFWGLLTLGGGSTIEDIKLNKPIKIIDGNSQEQYYFNGKKYNLLEDLKKEQLKQIINGEYLPTQNIKVLYSFIDKNKYPELFDSNLFASLGSIEDILCSPEEIAGNPKSLIQYVYMEIFREQNLPSESWIFHDENFVYGNGITIKPGDSNELAISQIIKNIKATKIAQIPILENNKPRDFKTIQEYNEANKYELPQISWDHNGIHINKSNKQYIIIDPNVKNEIISTENSINLVRNEFYKQFNVYSKNVLTQDIVNNNNFDNLETNIMNYKIYKATLSNGYTLFFLSESDAMNWLLSNMEFTVYDYNQTIEIYNYKEIVFNSKEEFENYIIENMEVKNG